MNNIIKCKDCSSKLEKGQKFCERCGTEISIFDTLSLKKFHPYSNYPYKIALSEFKKNPKKAIANGFVKIIYNDMNEIINVMAIVKDSEIPFPEMY